MQFIDKYGWPVELIKGRWILNFIRLLIHTRKIKRGKYNYWSCTNCDNVEYSEREIYCWKCGKGEMLYRGRDQVSEEEIERVMK